jgi:hypothetical protein
MRHQVLANFMQCDCDVSIIVYEYCLSHASDRGILLVVYVAPPCLGVFDILYVVAIVRHTLCRTCHRVQHDGRTYVAVPCS